MPLQLVQDFLAGFPRLIPQTGGGFGRLLPRNFS
jgi:hypothetical protein